MADDLGRYLRHEPVAARRDTLAYRTAKFVRRRRAPVAVAAVVALGVTSIVTFYAARLGLERDRAHQEAAKSARVTELMISLLTGADPYPSRTGEPTVRSLLDAGADRLAKDLQDQPARASRTAHRDRPRVSAPGRVRQGDAAPGAGRRTRPRERPTTRRRSRRRSTISACFAASVAT